MKFLMLRQGEQVRDDNAVLHASFDSYRLVRSVLGHVQQLVLLMADIQRHRACSMAILSGNGGFEQQVNALRRKINARISYLQGSPDLADVVDPAEWEAVVSEWRVVGYGWRRDHLLHNFELHSHLIDKIAGIVKTTGRWIMRSGNYSDYIAGLHLSHAFFEYLFSRGIVQIEVMGKLRGLGAHVASTGADDAMLSRLGYLAACAVEEHAAYRAFVLSQLSPQCAGIITPQQLDGISDGFAAWMLQVQQLREGIVQPSLAASYAVFGQATAVIDAMLHIHTQVMSCLQRVIDETFEFMLEQYFG